MRPSLVAAFSCLVLAASTAAAAPGPALPRVAPAPADNPTTAAKVALGQVLYFDPRFSSTGTVSCASCHNVMEGGDDHRPTSIGVHGQVGGRNAPTVWNAAFQTSQFWDGRAPTLEAQAKGPPANPIEMGMKDLDAVIARIRAIPGYAPLFAAAYGKGETITVDNAFKAIAAYERTLITPASAYDRFVSGDHKAMSAQAQRGMKTFEKTGCVGCHQGVNLSGPELPAGTPFLMLFPTYAESPYVAKYDLASDLGRAASTNRPEDAHYWRVPTLRNLVYTAPYMHNGKVKTLPEAVRVMASTQLNAQLSDQDVADVVAFLESITGTFPKQNMPRLPATPGDLIE
jgi:cytochrome c peroxidase